MHSAQSGRVLDWGIVGLPNSNFRKTDGGPSRVCYLSSTPWMNTRRSAASSSDRQQLTNLGQKVSMRRA